MAKRMPPSPTHHSCASLPFHHFLLPGVGMLIKMGGKDAEVPEVTITGPNRASDGAHVMQCVIKRSKRSMAITSEFYIQGGKIKYLRNSRK